MKALSTECTTKMKSVGFSMHTIITTDPRDKFIDLMEMEVMTGQKQAENIEKNRTILALTHEKTCQLFGLKLDDEICEKSPTFLKIF